MVNANQQSLDHIIIIVNLTVILYLCNPPDDLQHYVVTDKETALLLAGCSSNSPLLSSSYVLSLRYYQPEKATFPVMDPNITKGIVNSLNILGNYGPLEVRASYFEICAVDGWGVSCESSVTNLASLQYEQKVCRYPGGVSLSQFV